MGSGELWPSGPQSDGAPGQVAPGLEVDGQRPLHTSTPRQPLLTPALPPLPPFLACPVPAPAQA